MNDRENSTAASTQSSISNTVKRGYEETDHQPVINANTDLTMSNAKQIIESNVNTEGQLPLIVNSLLNIVTELSKKTTESPVVRKRHKPAQSKDPGSGTITFDGIPIYLIEEPCEEFRTASNGNEFQIILVETCTFGMQPVPKWKDDQRDFISLRQQARNNFKSRNTINMIARQQREREDDRARSSQGNQRRIGGAQGGHHGHENQSQNQNNVKKNKTKTVKSNQSGNTVRNNNDNKKSFYSYNSSLQVDL